MFVWAIRQILVPCNYLRIKHGDRLLESKAVYDFVFPIILTFITVIVCIWLGIPLSVESHAGLSRHLLDLLALMVVFYMAALAAVATFERVGIDDALRGGDATLMVRDHNKGAVRVPKKLTYRQFISYLFGYLSFLSLCLYVVMIFLIAGWSKLEDKVAFNALLSSFIKTCADPAIFVVVFFFIWQLVVTSLLGIYFLTERIQSLNDKET